MPRKRHRVRRLCCIPVCVCAAAVLGALEQQQPAAAPVLAAHTTHTAPEKPAEKKAAIPDTGSTDSAGTRSVAPASAVPEKPAHTGIGIPIPGDNALIQKYRAEFLSNYGKKWLATIMHHSSPYRQYIRDKLKEMQLPACLEYLPVIESNYNPHAVSKSGATGLWQFMENSISPYLEKTDWIDERLDPWKSTDAALKKLQENYAYFKSWEIALAAYNCGLGSMTRIIKKAGTGDYWKLSAAGVLSNQTTQYVPKFLVIADLLTNSEFYEIALPEFSAADTIEFAGFITPDSVSLNTLGEKSGIDTEILAFLNPALTRGCTPPGVPYTLRIPAGAEPLIGKAIGEINPDSCIVHTVVKGETLWGISRRYNLPLAELCSANEISMNGILSIGTVLKVPIHK